MRCEGREGDLLQKDGTNFPMRAMISVIRYLTPYLEYFKVKDFRFTPSTY